MLSIVVVSDDGSRVISGRNFPGGALPGESTRDELSRAGSYPGRKFSDMNHPGREFSRVSENCVSQYIIKFSRADLCGCNKKIQVQII